MKIHRFVSFFLITLLSALSVSTVASTDLWYQVEVIIFEHLDKRGLQETWPLEPGRPNTSQAQLLSSGTPQTQEGSVDQPARSLYQFTQLSETDLQLNDAKERIQKNGNYRIIVHKAWKQKIGDKKIAEKLRLIGGKQYTRTNTAHKQNTFGDSIAMEQTEIGAGADVRNTAYELDGTLMLSRSRHLHLDADLLFTKPMRVLSPAQGVEGSLSAAGSHKVLLGNVQNRNQWQQEANARLQPFRLNQTVRVRTNEVQYIDHPMYGMLVAVIPQK